MSTPLQSAKYLSPEYFEVAYAPPATDAAVWNSQQTDAPRWTGFLTVVVVLCGLLGAAGVLGGLNGFLSLDQNAELMRDAYAQSPAHANMLEKVLVAQSENKPVILFNMALRVIVGIGFVAGSVKLLRRRPNAHSFVTAVFACAIFYNVSNIVVAWLVMPSIPEIPGVSAEAVDVAQGVVAGMILVVVLIKSSIYAAIMAYLSKASIKAIFAAPDESANQTLDSAALA